MIDDDASIRRVGELSLARVGKWDVLMCDSAEAGLLRLESECPDVVLLDVMMPLLDGITALPEILRKTKGQIPIIFMTAKVMKHEIDRYSELGAAGVISKPFDPLALPNEVLSIYNAYHALKSPICA